MMQQPEKTQPFGESERAVMQQKRPPEAKRYFELIAERHRGKLEGEVNPVKALLPDSQALTGEIKDYARKLGTDLVGIAEVKQEYLYQGEQKDGMFAISLGMEMDYEQIATAPSPVAETESSRVYYELGEVTIRLAEYIRGLGYPSYPHHPLAVRRLQGRSRSDQELRTRCQ